MASQWNLCRILGIDANNIAQKCVAENVSNSRKCGNVISVKDRKSAPRKVREIELLHQNSEDIHSKIEELAALLLCKHQHSAGKRSSQVETVTEEWLQKIQDHDVEISVSETQHMEGNVFDNDDNMQAYVEASVAELLRQRCEQQERVIQRLQQQRIAEQDATAQTLANDRIVRRLQYDEIQSLLQQIRTERESAAQTIEIQRQQRLAQEFENELLAAENTQLRTRLASMTAAVEAAQNISTADSPTATPCLAHNLHTPEPASNPAPNPDQAATQPLPEDPQVPEPEISRAGVRRHALDEDCPSCLEPIDSLEDSVWCQNTCGKNMHAECFGQWAAHCIGQGRPVTCCFCRGQWTE